MLDLLDERERRPWLPSGTPAPLASTVSTDGNTSVKASEVSYFYPNILREWGENDVVDRDGKVYYCNVYKFTNRIRVAAQTWDMNKLKQTPDMCLRGEAELWWNNQLSHIMPASYLATSGVEDYCKALETRFRPPLSEAFAKDNATRYSVDDCRARKSITKYLAMLEAAAKSCGLGPVNDDTQKF